MSDALRVVVGTSGWSYPDWYPRGVSPRERLAWYGRRFAGVEVDSTFYAVPGPRTTARWEAVTPPGFTFDVKLHRLLSRHAAPRSSLPTDLRERATVAESGRVVLDAELEAALCERTLAAAEPLRDAGKLDDLAYLRAHGRNADGYLRARTPSERFGWGYSDEELDEIGERARALTREAASVRLMFGNGNDASAAAGADARSPRRARTGRMTMRRVRRARFRAKRRGPPATPRAA